MSGIVLQPIGVIHTPYRTRSQAPRQGRYGTGTSVLEIFPQFAEGLDGIERSPFLNVLWWADQAERDLLKVTPPGETEVRGVFSTRSPARPNPLGLTLVRVVSREGNRLLVEWMDALDGTALIDIKLYSRELDCAEEESPLR